MVRKALVCGAIAAVALFGATSAVAGPWAQQAGASDSFTYAAGQDLNNHFGEPYVSADTFFFIDSNFQVQSQNGGNVTQDDTVSFDVFANAGLRFSLIRITAFGSYSSTGPGMNSVSQSGLLSLTEIGPPGRAWQQQMDTNPTFPKSDDNGGWSGLTTLDLSADFPDPTAVHIDLSSDVVAITGAGGSAEINVQYEDLKIEFLLIPEPASLSLMAVGALALLRRRRVV